MSDKLIGNVETPSMLTEAIQRSLELNKRLLDLKIELGTVSDTLLGGTPTAENDRAMSNPDGHRDILMLNLECSHTFLSELEDIVSRLSGNT